VIKWGLKPLIAAIAVVTLGIGSGVWIHSHSQGVITLDVDGKKTTVVNRGSATVGDLLRSNGIAYHSPDSLKPAASTRLTSNLHIALTHAKRVQLVNEAQEQWVQTMASTVGQLLVQQQIALTDTEYLNVEKSAPIVSNLKIVITHQRKSVDVATRSIPFNTVRKADDNAYKNEERVVSAGQTGEEQITTTTVYRNGKQIDQTVANEMVRQPTDKIIAFGTQDRPVTVASRSESFLSAHTISVVATGYVAGGRTATGAPAEYGSVAVDPRVIPLGTKLYIKGYGNGIADDVGGAIQGDRIDLCFNSEKQAEEFGRQSITVYIVSN